MRDNARRSPKACIKVRVKSTLAYIPLRVVIFLIFTFSLGNNEQALAAVAADYTSRDHNVGNWDDASNWEINKQPGPEIGWAKKAEIYGYLKRTGTLTMNSEAILTIYDTLLVNGDLVINSPAQLNVSPNGVLVVLGNFIVKSSNLLNNAGRIVVTGAVSVGWQTTIDNNGAIYFYDEAPAYSSEVTHNGTLIKNESNLSIDDKPLYDFVNGGGVLPITLGYFTATISPSDAILVEWSTVAEKANDFFTLERSIDGKIFETIATIDGAGDSNQTLWYRFEDKKSVVGMNYYRLKQTDLNGNFEYFKIVGINNAAGISVVSEDTEIINLNNAFPNPFKHTINLSFMAKMDGEAEVLIQNTLGENVHKQTFSFYYGKNEYLFTQGDLLKPGIYYVYLKHKGKRYKPQRLIKCN